MTQRNILAVIFDLDGLLVDSEPVQFEAWERYLQTHGAELTSELLGRMHGTRLVDSSRMVVEALGLDVTADVVARERDALFLEMVPGRIKAKPGALDLLEYLWSRGVPTALATSGHRRYVDLALESACIPRRFDAEVTGELVERGKPDPETFLTAARSLAVEPATCLVLEDSPNGVRAARAAGMVCVAVPEALAAADRFEEADLIVGSLSDVLTALENQGFELSSASQG